MNLISNKERMLSLPIKATTLNPNAAAFVPSSLRSTIKTDGLGAPGTSKDTTLEQQSSLSNNSDDEAHQYWQHQLPDDITPDFKVMGEDELHGPENLSLAGLPISDAADASKFPTSANSGLSLHQRASPFSMKERIGHSNSAFTAAQSSIAIAALSPTSWGKPFVNSGQFGMNVRGALHYNGDSSTGSVHRDLISRSLSTEDASINPMKFLSMRFPGLPFKSLTDAYYRCGQDLKATVETLNQLQNHVEGALQAGHTYRTLTTFRGSADSTSAPEWRPTRDGSLFAAVGSSTSPQIMASVYNSSDKLQNIIGARAAPTLLEPEETADMLFESKEDTPDLTHLSNAIMEQARHAYLIGDSTLAKELNLKGQLLNQQINAAREKPRDAIYWQRNLPLLPPLLSELQGDGHERDPVIDLRGFHLNEAIHILNSRLSKLRRMAGLTGKQLQALILTGGTGGQTRDIQSAPSPAGVVEQYLLEHGVRCFQPQPGLLRVVIY